MDIEIGRVQLKQIDIVSWFECEEITDIFVALSNHLLDPSITFLGPARKTGISAIDQFMDVHFGWIRHETFDYLLDIVWKEVNRNCVHAVTRYGP